MIPLFKVFVAPEASKAVTDVLQSGFITQGKEVDEFEEKLSEWFEGFPRIVTLNSATSGLTLALRLLDLDDGDEVLCTPLTCWASNAPVLANRLHIKWVDVDPDTCTMDLDDLERKLSPTTRAILCVHWGGQPIDMDRMCAIRDAYDPSIAIVEDCAHAFGARAHNGKLVGTSHGNLCVFSTQAIKHLTTGDGGLLFLPTEEMYRRARLLRWYGIDRDARKSPKDFRMESDIVEWGYKFHMNDIAASIGSANLPYIVCHLEHARSIASYYDRSLGGLSLPNGKSVVLDNTRGGLGAFWLYTLRIPGKPEFITYMRDTHNVMTSQVHNRNDLHSCVSAFTADLPQLCEIVNDIVCIPIGPWVSLDDAHRIVLAIRQWCLQENSDELRVRSIKVEDRAAYLDLLFQLNGHRVDLTDERWEEKLALILTCSRIMVLEFQGQLIGSVKVVIEEKFGDPIAHVEDMVVDQNWRGLKLGQFLIQCALELGASSGCHKTVLHSKGSVAPFYLKQTFECEGDGVSLVHRHRR